MNIVKILLSEFIYMYYNHIMKYLICVLAILLLTACETEPKQKRGGSKILLNYAKTPLDKAKGVNKINDDYNKKLEQELKNH